MSLFHSNSTALQNVADDLTLPQFLIDNAARHPTRPERPRDVPCLVDDESSREVYFDEMSTRTDALARGMRETWGIGKDDIVAMYAPNHIDYPICLWATHRLGAIVAATSPALTAPELVYQLQIARPSLIIAHISNLSIALEAASTIGLPHTHVIVLDAQKAASPGSLKRESVDEVIERGRAASPIPEIMLRKGEAKKKIAVLCFSSGTTGKPKAVAVSHYNMICNILQTATFLRINENYCPDEEKRFQVGDKCCAVLPFYHIYGLIANLHFTLYAGMTVVVVQKFVHESLLQSIEKRRISHLFLVPPQVVLFCKHPATRNYDLSSVRFCMVAAAPLTAEVTTQMLELMPGIHLGQGYGLTETCAAVSLFPTTSRVGTMGSAGQLVSGTVAKVVKPDGTLAGPGEPGELWVQGGQIAMGYYKNEQATKESFIDGWFRTGDEVIIQNNGDIFITDRIKELIKVKGYQVAPAELEGHLLGHPHVADAGVVGIPDDFSGELPLAFIVLQQQIRKEVALRADVAEEVKRSIAEHVSSAKSHYKWLTGGIVFIDQIPKNASGKILRRMLREHAKTLPREKQPVRARL
ncbi:acetyl-CoA synthetase-like protein [Wolfiporia cocos MD-104 SS10]|uniref:Acetyl-CoA synthetase-like protein n=1 Tax=Wolfiporia cocos (strain MD-104) TaxID=742152 RepID=A0A2H3J7M3_WOLCO|nr:acetyl-CoA synthetase-like protein [Wolfiporia cocos MD-104 SS10]